jgi:hypothetical protein
MAERPKLRVVTIGNPSSVRVASFQSALERSGQPPSEVVSYLDLLEGRLGLEQALREGDFLRIESPGQEFEVEKRLIALGAGVEDEPGPSRIGRDEALRLPFDRGRIWFPRQWFLGFRELLRRVDRQRAACSWHVAMNAPSEIEVMFDKPRCHGFLTSLGVSCPQSLGPIRSYDELRQRMREAGMTRVFVKLAHGSSASGVVAFAVGPRALLAITTAEVVREGGEVRLYNSRAIRRIENEREIAVLVDVLALEGVQVERWVPKAGIDDHVFDLRVVVIAGKARHVVVRMSRGPLTNLHLKNQRSDPSALRSLMAEEAWDAAMGEAERASAAFPGSLHAGVDLLIAPGYRRRAVLEVNAFGDLLHGVTDQGLSTHEAEIRAMLGGWAA